ncbi:hypothetical protein PR202_gb22925 [Eleusine coracana subsp. coracana]|uniref:Signal recognition particle 19 kDa protein n=1 Tax=Eleusine coracana subsp. coracana TaxID=191504 RepID=A0AAV5FJ44_ELECO|nr:hypothetical protein PR202_gb22925 [Eleusine coracana subsp. coracana]
MDGGGGDMRSTIKKWNVIYPVYLNSKKSVAEGRRIAAAKACPDPTCIEIADCCSHLKIPHAIELDKAYPRDFFQVGRVRVQLKKDDGSPVNPAIKTTSEVFGVSRGGKQEAKDTWWWNDEVQRAIKEKNECFKRLHLDKSAANIEGYKIAKRAAKRAVSVAKGHAYDNLYQGLGTKEGEKDIYRMARIRERKTRDINQIKYIKDGVDRLLVRDEEIKDRWREYFDKLFNGEEEGSILELDDSFGDNNRRFVRRIQEAEIEQALKRMKSGKAMGPNGILIEPHIFTEKQLMIQIAELVPKHHGRTKKQEPQTNASNAGPSKTKGGKKKK